jgi:hypothetical protein
MSGVCCVALVACYLSRTNAIKADLLVVLRHKRLGRTNRSGRDGGTQANSLRYNNWLKQHRLDSRLVHQMLAQMSIA